MKKSKEGV